MELGKIMERINAVFIAPDATITQLKREEDGSFYQVWKINSGDEVYILKEAKGDEREIYQSLLYSFKGCVPAIYQVIAYEEKTYLLMEYVNGDTLCKCTRKKLTLALNALISLQNETWQDNNANNCEHFYKESVIYRKQRGKYLNDRLLEEAYDKFLEVYQTLPRALCHDDLLPFNVVVSNKSAFIIDWECGGVLPYATSFARLIAHVEDDEKALFYMKKEDKEYAVKYYYDNLLKDKGISYSTWLNTLEYFLFYEYCEWVFVGNKYNATDGEYYKKYLPIAKAQAIKILKISNG